MLRDVAATVLPSGIGRKGQDEAVDNFLRWIREYKEGVALSHGYGEPRLVKSGPSPAPGYSKQIAALQQAAQGRGGRFGALPLEVRRELIDAAFKAADVRNLPAVLTASTSSPTSWRITSGAAPPTTFATTRASAAILIAQFASLPCARSR